MHRLAPAAILGTALTLAVLAPVAAQVRPPPVDGTRLYVTKDCASCHEAHGEGGWNGERLAGNRNLMDQSLVVRAILFGGPFMPALGDQLTDEEVVAVADYIRNSWGNQAPPISIDYVTAVRGPPPL